MASGKIGEGFNSSKLAERTSQLNSAKSQSQVSSKLTEKMSQLKSAKSQSQSQTSSELTERMSQSNSTKSSSQTSSELIERMSQFEQFDVITDYSDHHYIHSNYKICLINDVQKRIMREWRILQHDLPKSIYVRVYEGRIDLLRAVIIGASGTPYHDCLFFFDFVFSYDYPNNPPEVYYHSHGLRLNPNLYNNGTVCLSVLNTWIGSKEEKWNPYQSTILQVLVSLQALVLNEKPYYNEPFALHLENWSKSYNTKVFALSCKTILYLLQKPPKNFEGFVHKHFQERANILLRACMAYRDERVSVGFFNCDGSSSQGKIKVSNKFKRSMDQLYGDLIAAFTNIGASLQNIEEEVENDRMKTVHVPDNILKKKSWIGSKFMMCFCVKGQE